MRRSPVAAAFLLALLLPAACTSAQDALQPSAIAPQDPAPADAAAAPLAAGVPETAAAPGPETAAIVTGRARMHIAPIVGATVEAATPLSEALAARARERGIGLAASGDPAATHVLKGYFSAIPEGRETLIVYVWDVYDRAGNRIHRINGQQRSSGDKGWSSVSAEAMRGIADTTMDQLAAWFASRTG